MTNPQYKIIYGESEDELAEKINDLIFDDKIHPREGLVGGVSVVNYEDIGVGFYQAVLLKG